MDIAAAVEFVREHHRSVISTFRADGRPQLSPVVAGVDAQDRVLVSLTESRAKVRNLRRDPRVALCVMTDEFFGHWVQVEGEAEIISLPDAMESLIELYRQIAGEHPNWEEYRQAMQDEQRCVMRLRVTHAVGT